MLIISLLLVMCRVASSSSTLNIISKYQHNNPVVYAEFSLDDKLIITCTSIQNQCFLRKIKSNHIIHTFNEEDLIKKVIYTDEKIILVFSYYIKIYSSITYEVEHRIKLEPYENIQGSFLNTDNKLIIISYRFLTSINIYNGDIENRTTYRYEQQNFIKYFYCHNNDNVVFYDKHNFKLVIYNTLSLKYSYIDYKLNECITSIYMDQMHSIIIIAYNNCIDIIDLKNFNYIDRIKNVINRILIKTL